jgi:hypothetical protein
VFPLLPNAPCIKFPDARLAPPHTHHLRAVTTAERGHRHVLQSFVYANNGSAYDGHIHDFQGITDQANGHRHRFYGRTGPALPLADGSHYHAVSGWTYLNYTQPVQVLIGGMPLEGGVIYSETAEGLHRHAYSAATSVNFGEPPADW